MLWIIYSRFSDIQGSGTFKVQGHSRFRGIQGSGTSKVKSKVTIEVTFKGTFTKWYWSSTGRDMIHSASEIGTRHGVW